MSNKELILPDYLSPDASASIVGDYWMLGKTGKDIAERRWAETQQYIFATSTKETANVSNPWSHTTHIPKLTQIRDNLGANYHAALTSRKDWFAFAPTEQESADYEIGKAVSAYLVTKHRQRKFHKTMLACLQDWVDYGNCFAETQYIQESVKDSDGNVIVQYTGPDTRRISPYDIVFDHTASSFDSASKCIRDLVTVASIQKMVDSHPEKSEAMQEALFRIKEIRSAFSGWDAQDIHKVTQDRFDGFTTTSDYYQSGMVELLTYYGDIYDPVTDTVLQNHRIVVADRRYLLELRPLDNWDGRPHIRHAAWRKRGDNLWGQGPLDNLLGMQYYINHIENARADAMDQMIHQDRVHTGNVEMVQDGPVTNYYIDDAQGDVRNLGPDPTILQADFKIQLLEAQMEAYAGAPREAMGIRSPGEKTAFEVDKLITAAQRMFQTKLYDFEEDFLNDVLNDQLETSRRNFNGTDQAIFFDEGVGIREFLEITPDVLTSSGNLYARGSQHFAAKSRRAQTLQTFETVLASDPKMKVHFPGKKRAKLWADTLETELQDAFEEFGQITEDMEAQRMLNNAQTAVATETGIDPETGEEI